MSKLLSCQQSARMIGVSKSTVKRLCDSGSLRYSRTPGGHRRIALTELSKWALHKGLELRLDSGHIRSTRRKLTIARVLSLLESGDSRALSDQIIEEIHKGLLLAEVLDDLIAPAFWQIGQLWEEEKLDPFEEHFRSQVIVDTFSHLRSQIDEISAPSHSTNDSQVAIGAVVGNELHHIPSTMVELVLSQMGWRAWSLGAILPMDSLIKATQELSPRLIWVSYTCLNDVETTIEENDRLFSRLEPHQRLVLGGQALTREIRRKLKFHFAGDSLCHLMSYASSIITE